ncbi:bifunctional 5,10-methylenetetrahydrofolate dehydrogenase/5,10-methenyltetrahydrofolate cyclohydrolase, partial [bacterium]|nr:bifunctional 5,10-methylenetetrahydrofolate dehydrogenase/5,10-methenyltetrahydrofolate cyclohydrolase [bacterium]
YQNMKLIDGHKIADKIKDKIIKEIISINAKEVNLPKDKIIPKKRPNLAIILIGAREDSGLYVRLKEKEAKKVGIDTHLYKIPETSTEKEVKEIIEHLNKDDLIDAILVQLPLPEHFNADEIVKIIDPKKDVDRFHPDNLKELTESCNHKHVMPPVFQVVFYVLDEARFDLKDRKVCVLAKSQIFTNALKHVLECRGAQVVIVSPYAEKLKEKTIEADLLITVVGQPGLIKEDMIKKGVGIIDIGITKKDKYILGDVDREGIKEKVSFLTPVPGGVGPITIATALKNTLDLFKENKEVN